MSVGADAIVDGAPLAEVLATADADTIGGGTLFTEVLLTVGSALLTDVRLAVPGNR